MPRPSLLVILVAGGTLVAGCSGDGDGAASPDGPVAAAEPRDLRTVESVVGTLARADATTVLHGGAGGSTAPGSGMSAAGDGLGSTAGGTDDGTAQDTSATVTEIVAIGEEVGQGSTLYRADDEPVVALLAADPLFRDLDTGADDGADVLALEQGLAALGYGDGLTVDSSYDSATATAVEAWETDLGRAAPDGVVTVGEVVLMAEPATVLGQDAAVGDTVQTGTPVLTLGTESQVVDVPVDATETGEWAVGTPVEVAWSDGSVGTGSVVELGRDEADGTVPAVVALAQQDGSRPVGTEVDVVRTTAERPGTLAVPVAAVVFGDDGPVVRVVDGDASAAADVATDVTLGIVAGGWVEITDGLAEGDQVRLPG